MNMIVTTDKKWAIGNQGQRLVSIPEEQRLLREDTLGKVIVMGRKTFEALPGKQPLYGRTNVILSENPAYKVKGALVCHSLEEALKELSACPSDSIFVIGGRSIYEQFLPHCDVVHAARVDYEYAADAHFPDLDQSPEWEMALETEEQTYFNLCYTFRMYQRKISRKSQ